MDNGASCYRRFREDGDAEGLVELIRLYRDALIMYLCTFVRDFSTAEELAEDTFVYLGTKKPKDKGGYAFSTWLYTIARRLALDHLRKARRRNEHLAEECGALALVTGESVGQVASQTLASLGCTNEVTDLPVLRPLIAFDRIRADTLARVF